MNETIIINKLTQLKSTITAVREVILFLERRNTAEEDPTIKKSLKNMIDGLRKETTKMVKNLICGEEETKKEVK